MSQALDRRVPRREMSRTADPRAFYAEALRVLSAAGIPVLIGGMYAMARHLDVDRDTGDLDIFVLPEDVDGILDLFRYRHCAVELTFPHWLAKLRRKAALIDVIFGSGNGAGRVDAEWFVHAKDDTLLGVPVKLCPPEEMLWSKAFVQERERFDGADVLHLLLHFGEALDWVRLLSRFGDHWRVLLSHVVLFGFVYPGQRDRIPTWVSRELATRLADEPSDRESRLCFGPLLSRQQYLHDIRAGGYQDARLEPTGRMTPDQIRIWTDAIDDCRDAEGQGGIRVSNSPRRGIERVRVTGEPGGTDAEDSKQRQASPKAEWEDC